MTKLPDPNDVFAPVPASYPFEQQLEDNKAKLEEQQAENPLPEPFAAQVSAGTTRSSGPKPTATNEPSESTHTPKASKS